MAAFARFQVPQVTPEELRAFHEAHFSQHLIGDFKATFLGVAQEQAHESRSDAPEYNHATSYDDSCGECETEEFLENEPVDETQGDGREVKFPIALDLENLMSYEEGETSVEEPVREAAEESSKTTASRKKRRRKKSSGPARRTEDKPDLRKRTWDVVDTGLGSLDYDGLKSAQPSASAQPQRRRVQYGDD